CSFSPDPRERFSNAPRVSRCSLLHRDSVQLVASTRVTSSIGASARESPASSRGHLTFETNKKSSGALGNLHAVSRLPVVEAAHMKKSSWNAGRFVFVLDIISADRLPAMIARATTASASPKLRANLGYQIRHGETHGAYNA